MFNISDLETRFKKTKEKLTNQVIVLSGGDSSEVASSLLTGKNVYDALTQNGLNTRLFDPSTVSISELVMELTKSSFVFNALHGGKGENGTIQALLDYIGVLYNGSGPESSAVCKNKLITKAILNSINVATPKSVTLKDESCDAFIKQCSKILNWPFVIKFPDEGSCQGVFLVNTPAVSKDVLSKCKHQNGIFAEKYIPGKEISTLIIQENNQLIAGPILEEINGNPFKNSSTLENSKSLKRIIPADLSGKTSEKIIEDSLNAFKALKCRDYARFDIRLSLENIPYFLEATTLPSIKTDSRLPAIFLAMGLDINQTIKYLVCLAVERHEQ
jgi:D-alanine-D-alanine ligase